MESHDLATLLHGSVSPSALARVPAGMVSGVTADDLWAALAEGDLEVHYQPIVRLIGTSGDEEHPVIGAEALLRWRHPVLGLVGPEEFLIAFENDAELIRAIEVHVLLVATQAAAHAGIEVAVNLSPIRFDEGDELILSVSRALDGTSLHPPDLTLEITERELPRDMASAAKAVEQLQLLGVQVVSDDFGTGYSSVYVENLALDGIKLDGVFVRAAAESQQSREAVEEVVDRAHKLALTVVAEGVESRRQSVVARAIGCDYAQGYFYGRPGPSIPARGA
ncbi:MAG: EAL domain-containing protein [Acidimicrobiales bacterium]